MTVDLTGGHRSADEVGNFVVAELRARGFKDIGRDGRDVLKNRKTAIYLQGSAGLQVVVQLDLPNEVPIRVSENGKTFDADANRIFEDLAGALEVRWPGSVVREPTPTK